MTVGCEVHPTVDNLRHCRESGADRVTLTPCGRLRGGRFADEVLSRLGD